MIERNNDIKNKVEKNEKAEKNKKKEKTERIRVRGSPRTRVLVAGELKCPKCKHAMEVNQIIFMQTKGKILAKMILRCKIGCKNNLKEELYYLTTAEDIDKLKKKIKKSFEEITKQKEKKEVKLEKIEVKSKA